MFHGTDHDIHADGSSPATADLVIAGAGVAGLTLALELRRRGRNVLLLERSTAAGAGASNAAAGMLATHDPYHPAPLQPLADLASTLYPDLYDRIRTLSGHPLPFHTAAVLEEHANGTPGHTLLPQLAPTAGNFLLRKEHSINPREFVAALAAAVHNSGATLLTGAALTAVTATASGIAVHTAHGQTMQARQFVDTTGAWSLTGAATQPALASAGGTGTATPTTDSTAASAPFARPARGQMLRVQLTPGALQLRTGGNAVIRTSDLYIVPRLDGSAVIGSTVEDAGFDLTTHPHTLQELRTRAAELLPSIATAPEVEHWSGLRPRSTDDLPVLGTVAPNHFVANGLFRNGILLAPAVAHVMAQLLAGEPTSIPLDAFSPHRTSLRHAPTTR